jgi:hypothetical protein
MGLGQFRGLSWETGTPLHCPNQGYIVASGGLEVCDAAHRCFVMKEGRSQIAGVEHPEVSTLTTPPKRSWDGSGPSGIQMIRDGPGLPPAVAEKVGVVENAADFFKKRAGKATSEGLMKFLRTAPKAAPEPEDTLR